MEKTTEEMTFATEAECRAYEIGKAQGIMQSKEEWTKNGRFHATLACVQKLMQKLGISGDQAMALLDLPKKDRKVYEKILANRAKQKQEAKKMREKK